MSGGECVKEKIEVIREGKEWVVQSFSGNEQYVVEKLGEKYVCTCPQFLFRKKRCKHIEAVVEYEHEQGL